MAAIDSSRRSAASSGRRVGMAFTPGDQPRQGPLRVKASPARGGHKPVSSEGLSGEPWRQRITAATKVQGHGQQLR